MCIQIDIWMFGVDFKIDRFLCTDKRVCGQLDVTGKTVLYIELKMDACKTQHDIQLFVAFAHRISIFPCILIFISCTIGKPSSNNNKLICIFFQVENISTNINIHI